jgi:hypothetical protein
MKSHAFWVRRFLAVFGAAAGVLCAIQIAKGHPFEAALQFGAAWGLASAAMLIGVRYYKARKGVACAICRDTVED